MFITIAAFVLRLADFSGHGIWQDEAAAYLQVAGGFYDTNADAPLSQWVLSFFTFVMQWQTIDGLRFTTLSIASLLPLAGFIVGRKLADDRVGILSALIFAIHPFFLVFSQQIRPYYLFSIIVLILFYFAAEHLYVRNRRWWVCFAILLAFFTHLLSLHILIPFFCLFLWIHRDKQKTFFKWHKYYNDILFFTLFFVVGISWIATRTRLLRPALGTKYDLPSAGDYLHYLAELNPFGYQLSYLGLLPFVFVAISFFLCNDKKYQGFFKFFFAITCFAVIINYFGWGGKIFFPMEKRYFICTLVTIIPIFAIAVFDCWDRLKNNYILRSLLTAATLCLILVMGNECKEIIQKKLANRYTAVSNSTERIVKTAEKEGVKVIVGSEKATDRLITSMVSLADRPDLRFYVYQEGQIYSLEFLRQKNGFLFPTKGKTPDLSSVKKFVSLKEKCERLHFGEIRFVEKKKLSKFTSICVPATDDPT